MNLITHSENEADVIKLLENGVSANGQDDNRKNPMNLAAERGMVMDAKCELKD